MEMKSHAGFHCLNLPHALASHAFACNYHCPFPENAETQGINGTRIAVVTGYCERSAAASTPAQMAATSSSAVT
jgi:hypothetical protein